jgi:hypothetical protein
MVALRKDPPCFLVGHVLGGAQPPFFLICRTDANCVCNSQAVADAVASCAVDQCSISDIQAAEGFVNDFCSGLYIPSCCLLGKK